MGTKAKDQPVACKDVEAAIAAIEELPKSIDLNLRTLRGDLRDYILGLFKTRPKGWKEMSEMEQREFAKAIDDQARDFITELAKVIASEGAQVVDGKLEKIVLKDGMQLTVTCVNNHDNLAALGDQVASPILIVKPLNKVPQGEKAKVQIDKDQGSLIPDADDDLLSSAADAESVGSKAAKDFAEDNPGSAGGAPDAEAPLADPAAEADAALAGSTQPSADEE